MKKHIERMKEELFELERRIEKLTKFVEKEIFEPNLTDEIQRIKLACQLEYMLNYASVLKERIKYDEEKISVGDK